MIIDHIGIVVKSISVGISLWEDIFGYSQHTQPVVNSRQKVKVVFLSKKDSLPVKLVEPIDQDSSVFRFAQKGGGLHHLCFRCGDVTTQVNILQKKDVRILAPPQPGEAFDNEKIAFVYAKNCLNIELIDTEKRAGVISIEE